MKDCVGSGLVDEEASRPLANSVEGDEDLEEDPSSVEVATGLARRNS